MIALGLLGAEVAELADALDSGSSARKGVGVRVPPSAPSDSRIVSPHRLPPALPGSTLYHSRCPCAPVAPPEPGPPPRPASVPSPRGRSARPGRARPSPTSHQAPGRDQVHTRQHQPARVGVPEGVRGHLAGEPRHFDPRRETVRHLVAVREDAGFAKVPGDAGQHLLTRPESSMYRGLPLLEVGRVRSPRLVSTWSNRAASSSPRRAPV